jgi:hypothetical protein
VDRSLRDAWRGRDDGRPQGGIAALASGDGRRTAHEKVSTVDKLADKLEDVSEREAAKGGIHSKIADELADDAAFLRKLKPSLMVARAKGEAPTNEKPGETRAAPGGPQLASRPKPKRTGNGPSPWLIVGGALVLGVFLAKVVDWRSHAHPHD